ncbi:MAG: hypothetical protein KAT57_07010 [Candidatus Lokiarchaeota archaeon]|nr:hypothetical protein [Candidatus Lokiarchaeota archaeon]
MKKKDYLNTIRYAGFQEIEIIGESFFPIKYAFTEDTVKKLIEMGTLTMEQAEEIKNFDCDGISVKVRAYKPN